MTSLSTGFETRIVKALFALSLAVALLATFFPEVQGQTVAPVSGSTSTENLDSTFDSDIETIINKINQIREIAGSCSNGECVDLPCRTLRKLNEDVFNADYYLKYALVWNRTAYRKNREKWVEYVNRQTAGSEAARRLELNTAYMEFVTHSVRAAADVMAVAASLRAFRGGSLADGSFLQAVSRLDDLMKGVRSLEDLRNIYRRVDGHDERDLFQISDPDLRLLQTTASNLKTIVQNKGRSGDWRTALRQKTSIAATIQILARAAVAFAQPEIDRRNRKLREIENELRTQNREMTATFDASSLYVGRLDKIERAYRKLDGMLKRNGSAYWLDCNRTSCILNPQPTVSSPPDEFRANFTIGDINNARANDPENWLAATSYFDGKLAEVARMTIPESTLARPGITLAKTVFEPGEMINANFTAPRCYPARSWIGVIPSGVPHGNVTTNIGARISSPTYLRNRTSGEALHQAPNTEGVYDLRMNDIGSNKEVYSISFEVRKSEEEPTPETPTSAASAPANDGSDWLIGRWEVYEDGLGRRLENDLGLIIEFVREDGKISGYIRSVSKNASERRLEVGEKIFRDMAVGTKPPSFPVHIITGQGLRSTFSRFNKNGTKSWQPATAVIQARQTWLSVTNTNFSSLRFRKLR